MGFRETYGGMIEAVLNAEVDKLDAEGIKKQLHDVIDKLVDDKIEGIKESMKSVIDKIDGEVG